MRTSWVLGYRPVTWGEEAFITGVARTHLFTFRGVISGDWHSSLLSSFLSLAAVDNNDRCMSKPCLQRARLWDVRIDDVSQVVDMNTKAR